MKEQAIPILNFILKKISTDKLKIPKCNAIHIDDLQFHFNKQACEVEFSMSYVFNSQILGCKGVLVGEELICGMHKSLENLLYVGYWVKRKHTRNATSFQLRQVGADRDDLVNYSIIYICQESTGQYKYSVSDESNLEKSLKNIVKLDYTEELYEFTFS